jgi:hypothetical protein
LPAGCVQQGGALSSTGMLILWRTGTPWVSPSALDQEPFSCARLARELNASMPREDGWAACPGQAWLLQLSSADAARLANEIVLRSDGLAEPKTSCMDCAGWGATVVGPFGVDAHGSGWGDDPSGIVAFFDALASQAEAAAHQQLVYNCFEVSPCVALPDVLPHDLQRPSSPALAGSPLPRADRLTVS